MESNVGDIVCGRCGHRGPVWSGRFGGVRCHVCFQLQGGRPRLPDDRWAERVREAFNIPEPVVAERDEEKYQCVILKDGGPQRWPRKRS